VAIDGDDIIALPQPPPPRPAARRAAIDAALQKFDGKEEASIKPTRRPMFAGWGVKDRRAMGALATAALIAVVSVPLALTTLRDNVPPSVTPAEVPAQSGAVADRGACAEEPCGNVAAIAPVTESQPAEPLNTAETPSLARSAQSADATETSAAGTTSAANELKAQEAPAPMIAVTAPAPAAPPPPPPPPAPAVEQFAEEATADSIVVTGSRVSQSNLAKRGDAGSVAQRAENSGNEAYGAFLERLQSALRANDRSAVTALVALPLRVNIDGQTVTYRTASEVERDFDRIFTLRVRQSVRNQRLDTLRSRGSRMKGTSRLWFEQSSPNGQIRIREVTP
jgi:hypothetical protein